ncbi:MAG: hypothetical protein GX591_04845 [Planctomycetes bacterium]|nr:hypothetical protein [Planctomycetota bacterium]
MFTRRGIYYRLACVFLTTSLLAVAAAGQTTTFAVPGGGAGDWFDPAWWSDGVPQDGYYVDIADGVAVLDTPGATVDLYFLDVYPTAWLRQTDGTLNVRRIGLFAGEFDPGATYALSGTGSVRSGDLWVGSDRWVNLDAYFRQTGGTADIGELVIDTYYYNARKAQERLCRRPM